MQAVLKSYSFSTSTNEMNEDCFWSGSCDFWCCVNVTFKYQLIRSDICENCSGPTEIRTRIAGFKVQSANHYTIGPDVLKMRLRRL